MKLLEKKFSYRQLEKVCEEQGWQIPSAADVAPNVLSKPYIWVTDKVPMTVYKDDEYDDGVRLGYCINTKTLELFVRNKNWLLPSAVLRKKPHVGWKDRLSSAIFNLLTTVKQYVNTKGKIR